MGRTFLEVAAIEWYNARRDVSLHTGLKDIRVDHEFRGKFKRLADAEAELARVTKMYTSSECG